MIIIYCCAWKEMKTHKKPMRKSEYSWFEPLCGDFTANASIENSKKEKIREEEEELSHCTIFKQNSFKHSTSDFGDTDQILGCEHQIRSHILKRSRPIHFSHRTKRNERSRGENLWGFFFLFFFFFGFRILLLYVWMCASACACICIMFITLCISCAQCNRMWICEKWSR